MTATDPGALHNFQLRGSVPMGSEQHLVPVIFEPWARRMVAAAAVNDDDRVLDLACGTGIISRTVADQPGWAGSLVAIDINPAMLEVCQQTAVTTGVTVDTHEAAAEALPLPDAYFDVAVCQFALMFFDDPVAAVAEMARVLKPGGRVALSVFRGLMHCPGYDHFMRAVRQHVGEDAATMVASPFSFDDPDRVRSLLLHAGFTNIDLRIEVDLERYPDPSEMVRMEVESTPLAPLFHQLTPQTVDALVQTLATDLADHTDDGGIAFPAQAWIATATAA
ncbi:methyltransferase domain-containing protein [soil metagenome]